MYQTISGFYENGQVFFTEPVPIQEKVAVMVTFLEQAAPVSNTQKLAKGEIRFGGFESLITISDDFNEPLEDLKEYMY